MASAAVIVDSTNIAIRNRLNQLRMIAKQMQWPIPNDKDCLFLNYQPDFNLNCLQTLEVIQKYGLNELPEELAFAVVHRDTQLLVG